MPRFLDTLTGQFVWKDSPASVIYAILFHTWRSAEQGSEQSYDDVCKLQAEVEASHASKYPLYSRANRVGVDPLESRTNGIFSHPALSDKISGSCRIAREAGYRLIWNDACCIDKSSSAELTEAINSMFQWYRLADVCYVYLADVPDEDAFGARFARSKWHRRGWTLQELIAPKRVVFLNQNWRIIGTKFGLALTLEKITNIDFNVLTGRAALDSISVARRMSWAARRETTRVEDRAYSLLGIFGVHMPTIYGEGSNAFLRLQEEIIKAMTDQSILAWGRACVLASSHVKDNRLPGDTDGYGLLAESPAAFSGSGDVRPLSPADFASRVGRRKEDVPPLHSIFTPQGVRMELSCIALAQIPDLRQTFMTPRYASVDEAMCDECFQLGHAHVLALLQCEDEDGALLALPLCEPRFESGARRGLLVITHINCTKSLHHPVRTIRLARPALEEALEHLPAGPESMNLSIVQHYSRSMVQNLSRGCFSETRGSSSIGRNFWRRVDQGGSGVFRIAPHSSQELAMLCFFLSPLQCWHFLGEVILLTTLTPDPRVGRWQRRPRGTTELTITLIKNGEGYDNVPAGAPAVHFSVANQRCIIFADTDTRSPTDGPSSPLSSHTAPDTPPPCSSGSSSTSVSAFTCRPLLAGRALASTVFVVCWRTDEPGRQNVLNRRLLRLALERSAGATNANDFRDVWVAVEISDGYWSWSDTTDVGVDNSLLAPDSHNAFSMLQTRSQESFVCGPTGPAGGCATQPSVQLSPQGTHGVLSIVPDSAKREIFEDSRPPESVSKKLTIKTKALGIWRRWSRRSEKSSEAAAQTQPRSSEALNAGQDTR